MLHSIPLYCYPTESRNLWERAKLSANRGVTVVNCHNGPGATVDENYQAAVRSFGPALLHGYVDTDYGKKSLSKIESEVNRWQDFYGITSYFFDQVSSDSSGLEKLRPLIEFVKSHTATSVIGNPGTKPDMAAFTIFDVVCTFEGSSRDYFDTAAKSISVEAKSEQVWHLVYGSAPGQLPATRQRARETGAGHLGVSSFTLPHPWCDFEIF